MFVKNVCKINIKTCYAYMSSSLVGSSSSGSRGVERGRTTNRLQRWQCGGIMHDMPMKLKKGSWCVSLLHVQLYVALTQSF